MRQPEGFIVPKKENYICHLKKSLHGLQEAPRQWYKRFDAFMIRLNCTRCHYNTVYIFNNSVIPSFICYCMLMTCSLHPRISPWLAGSNLNLAMSLR